MKDKIKIKAGVFVVALLFLATTVTVNAIPPNPQVAEPVEFTTGDECIKLWQGTWFGEGDPNDCYSGEVAVDSQGNVIGCGASNKKAVILKYSPDGELQWDINATSLSEISEPLDLATLDPDYNEPKESQPLTPEQREVFEESVQGCAEIWSVCCDSQDCIIGAGTLEYENSSAVAVIVKYDLEGNQLWNQSFSYVSENVTMVIAGCVEVDSNDFLYVSGTVIVGINGRGFAMKIGPNGFVHWAKIYPNLEGLFFTVYTDIDVDSNDRPFAAGYSIVWSNWTYAMHALELGKYTGIIWNNLTIYNNMYCTAMTIDDDDNNYIYTSGSYDVGDTPGMIVKLTPSLDVIYTSFTPHDHFQDIAVKNDEEIVTASRRWNKPSEYHLILRPNGDYVTGFFCVPNGVDHYTVVDDEEANDYTDYVYIYSTSSYANDTFNFTDHTSETREITSVNIYARITMGGALYEDGIPNMYKFIICNETVTYSPEFNAHKGWHTVDYSFPENPETNNRWTWDDIDNLKVGIAFKGTMWTDMACTQIYVDAVYSSPGDQYTISLHRKSDGVRLGKYQIGEVHDAPNWHVTGTIGVAVDSNEDIVASGGMGAIDTMKVRIIPRGIVIVPVDTDEQISEG